MKFALVALALLPGTVVGVAVWGQCGGMGYSGSTVCDAGSSCVFSNPYYSQCLPSTSTAPAQTTTAPPQTTTAPPQTTTAPPATTTAPPASSNNGTDLPFGTLITGCTKSGTVAITFDDGPYQWTSALIDSLNAAGVKATFFMCGKLYACIYDNAAIVQKAYNSGHQVAMHTWSHPDLTTLTNAQITTEIQRTETAFKKIIGIRPKWIRPPYGATNAAVIAQLKSLNYKVVTWDLDSQDWNGASVSASEAMFNALGADPKIIPLEHDALQTTAQQLGPWLITWAKSRGLKMVTVSECVGESSNGLYDIVGGATSKDSTWNCN